MNVARWERPTRSSASSARAVPLGGGDAGVEQPVGDVLPHRGVLGQEELLEDEPDLPGPQPRQLAVVQPRRVDAADADHAAAGPLQRPDDVQQRGLARPGGPDDRHQLAPPDGEGHAPQGGHRRLLAVDLGHPVQLQYRVAHGDGTTTRSPARRSPSTWTRPPAGVEQAQLHGDQLASPAGAHDLDREPAAGLADERGDRDAQGALHALGRDVHLDRGLVEPARLGRVVEADVGRDGRVGGLAVLSAGAWATRPNRATLPVTGVLPGSVIWARSPFLTSPCWDASRFTCTCSVSDVALQDRCTRPGGSAELAGHLGDPHRLGQEDRVTEGERAGHVEALAALERLERLLRLREDVAGRYGRGRPRSRAGAGCG